MSNDLRPSPPNVTAALKPVRVEMPDFVEYFPELYHVEPNSDDTNFELVCPASDSGHCWHYIIEPCSGPCCWCNRQQEDDPQKIPVFENGLWRWIYQN